MASALSRVFRILRADFQARLRRRHPAAGYRPRSETPSPEAQAKAPRRDAVDPELARYYSNLEVPYGADLATVRDAWRRLVRRYHPDLHGADPERQRVATELVQGLNHAFEQLRLRLEVRD